MTDDQPIPALGALPWRFVKGVVDIAGLPDADRAEVAFAGRSNVGKSSLLNALTGQSGLARTSNTPGRTQEINFFAAADAYLVDLPGYGYAKAAKEKTVAWNALIRDYLRGRPNLRRVMLLIDARHGIKDNDTAVMDLLDGSAVSYQIILTKLDKLSRDEQESIVVTVAAQAKTHVAAHPELFATSSDKGWGIAPLRAEISSILFGAATR